MAASLPFLTLPDPVVSGEGALDPLGLAMISERLAEELLPGLRARMSRPRFLTAMAISASVCDGLQGQYASDGTTPAYLVFEWLLVEAFVRQCDESTTWRTPGILKARGVRASGDAMCARTYLKAPTVFGFHGVYKPLARHLGIVDDELRLRDRGYELLKIWQDEQGLNGFIESATGDGPGRMARQTLRSAVEDGLAASCTKRSGSWQGWQLLAKHVAPANIGSKEAKFIRQLLKDSTAAPRGEVFDLLRNIGDTEDPSEDQISRAFLVPGSGKELNARLNAIACYEKTCALLEEAFDWIRYLSSHSLGRPITGATFANDRRPGQLSKSLAQAMRKTQTALAVSPLGVQQLFAALSKGFDGVHDAGALFEAVLERHRRVQDEKPPEGKRSWFDRAPDGATVVRPPYRVRERPAAERAWGRPYRIDAVLSFLDDLKVARQ